MISRRQVREAVVQFLYGYDIEGGLDSNSMRLFFWDFITETDKRTLRVAVLKAIQHFAHGRMDRLAEFVERSETALAQIGSMPTAETLKDSLNRLLALESSWSIALEKLSKSDPSSEDMNEEFDADLTSFFKTDHDLAFHREQFLRDCQNYPQLRTQLEPISATIRRLQRISDRLRRVEFPEKFPEQADLSKIRNSKSDMTDLQMRTDEMVDAILKSKAEIDQKLTEIVHNYVPERIDPVDRAILRLGTYELLFTSTPPGAVINEAIELAKRFGTTDSGRFVNGLLDQVVKS